MPAKPMSALPPLTASVMESNSMSSICSSNPSLSAMAAAISASIPATCPPSTYSYGGNAALVAIMSLPSTEVVKPSPSAAPAPESSPPTPDSSAFSASLPELSELSSLPLPEASELSSALPSFASLLSVPVPLPDAGDPPQAVMDTAMREASSRAVNFFTFIIHSSQNKIIESAQCKPMERY